MRILVDENVPRAAEALGAFGDVVLRPGRGICRDVLADVDALVVRSITPVDRELLKGTPVRFVGTATVGTDHLDLDWLRAEGITIADAAGCSTESVAEYVLSALVELEHRDVIQLAESSIGVIGVGRIGSRVAELAAALGMSVVEHDPPRAVRQPGYRSAALEDALSCDVVTMHVPLVSEGPHATYHLIDAAALSGLRPGAVLINTSRGAVVDVGALAVATQPGAVVLDVWEGEPHVPESLQEVATLMTPHIAGYSWNGRMRGTWLMARALARFTGIPNTWRWPSPPGAPSVAGLTAEPPAAFVRRVVRTVYDICNDDAALRGAATGNAAERRLAFDRLRREYPVRFELADATVSPATPDQDEALRQLRIHAETAAG